MTVAILLLAVLIGQGVMLPSERRGGITVQLEVWVPDQGPAPGRGRVRLQLSVEGPASMQIDDPRLEDALASWRTVWRASSWADDGRVRGLTLELEQVKPGVTPLPGLRLRVREGPTLAWEEISWPELLREPRDVPDVIRIPEPPRSPWPGRLRLLALTLASLLATGWLVRLGWRWRQKRLRPVPSHVRALARIDVLASADNPRDGLLQLDTVVRGYIEEQTGVPASRCTTAELMTALWGQREIVPEIPDALGRFLARADLVKFAGDRPDAEGLRQGSEEAREVVTALAKVGQAQPHGENGEAGRGG